MGKHSFLFTKFIISIFFLSICTPSSAQTRGLRMDVLKNYEPIPAPLQPPAAKSGKIAFVGNITIPALSVGFNARDAFADADSSNKAIATFWHNPAFYKEVNAKLKMLPKMPMQNISAYRATEVDSITEIVSTTNIKPMTVDEFAQTLAYLISKQPASKIGILLQNGSGNIFFVETAPDQRVILRLLWQCSGRNGWCLVASPIGHGWITGDQIFLRNDSM